MFERQHKSEIDMRKASSSTVDNSSAQLAETIQNSPAKSEPGTSQLEHQATGNDPDNIVAPSEDGSENLKEKQKEPEAETSEDLGANVIGHSDSQPAKRLKLNE